MCTCESSFSEPETSFDVSWNSLQQYTFELKVLNIVVFIEFVVSQSPFQRRQWHPTPVLLPGKSHGRRRLVGCSHGVARSRTRLSNFTFTFHFHTLEKEMATHSNTLAWKIPWTEEPGRLQSWGLQESDMTERLHFHFLLSCIGEGNGNPLQCSCWRIPGTGKPGGLPSLGSH